MADPHILSFGLTDDRGKIRSYVLYVDSAATLAEIQTFVDAHLNKLEAVTGAVVSSVSVQFQLTITDPDNVSPVVDDWTSHGLLAGFVATGTGYKQSIYVPALRQTLVTAGVVTISGAVATWHASVTGGEAAVDITDKAGRDLASFLSCKPADRK